MDIVVILGTSRKHSESSKVACYVLEHLDAMTDVHYAFLDLSEKVIPIMTDRFPSEDNAPEVLTWLQKIQEAQGVIIVTPEYKNGYPGALKNFLDFLPAGVFRYKSIGIVTVSSGSGGGSNCLAQLRLVAIAMGGIVIPDRMQVANVTDIFTDEVNAGRKQLDLVSAKFLREFHKYCLLLKDAN